MRTAADKVDVASDRRRRENVPRHILCSRRIRYEREKDITYEQAVERMFEMLGDWKIMALASSVNDYVMVRNVSCLFYDEKIWFKTDKNFRKIRM